MTYCFRPHIPFPYFSLLYSHNSALNHTPLYTTTLEQSQLQFFRVLSYLKGQLKPQPQISKEKELKSNILDVAKANEASPTKVEEQARLEKPFFFNAIDINNFQLSFKKKDLEVNESLKDLAKIEVPSCKVENNAISNGFENPLGTRCLKNQILSLVKYFIHNFGKITQPQIQQEKLKYADNNDLKEVFDIVNQKYSATTKNREDMIRLVIRKGLTSMRNTLREELNLNAKQASLALCKKFFLQKTSDEIMNQNELEMEDKIINFFLPYKKQSRNKTPNARFIEEAFQSEDFLQAYVRYLSRFDEIMKEDIEKKIQKFVDFIYNCLKNRRINKIKEYKRLPWLNSWIETAKIIAHELVNTKVTSSPKKVLTESEILQKIFRKRKAACH